ncbi:thioredoxin family protein [Rufibacter aurantiacus]|uniref:thioredoxin family protein n=1 Tax=Rufibacter aurantiacus TaxID=2817374 RepID=UPI001B30C24C|nr:thioredoxin family protein [Rufibacter aurantiacus]
MNYQEYSAYFKGILEKDAAEQQPPYDNPDYLDYTNLNWSRMNRWFKTGKLSEEILEVVSKIDRPQSWIVITEPWCGDAAHNIPFIEMIARKNPLISVTYELRDTAPFRIEQYLTNGTRSIPKLIVRDQEGNNLGTWGPRPANCQLVFTQLQKEKAPFEKIKVEIQNWYNANKGEDLQKELVGVLSGTL